MEKIKALTSKGLDLERLNFIFVERLKDQIFKDRQLHLIELYFCILMILAAARTTFIHVFLKSGAEVV